MADMEGFTVDRTNRNTWHVINRADGSHWEAGNQAEVLASVDTYRANLAAKAAAEAEQAERLANPQVGEFGTTVPGEPTAFESFVPVTAAGKANAPAAIVDDAPGADYAAFKAWQASQEAVASPEVDSVGVTTPVTEGVERSN